MKAVQAYRKETLAKLKEWIAEMNARGHEQYYEIFVDGVKVVHKTPDTSEFDTYLTWMDSDTQFVKVLTYNTKNSHRSKPFEFRTTSFVESPNYKELVEALSKKNEELLKRLADAETHICNLESKLETATTRQSFDLPSILDTLGTLTGQFPGLTDKLVGLSGVIPPTTPTNEKKVEDVKVTYKRKDHPDDLAKKQTENPMNSVSDKEKNPQALGNTNAVLLESETRKIDELIAFLSCKPEYINTLHEIIQWEKGKNAA